MIALAVIAGGAGLYVVWTKPRSDALARGIAAYDHGDWASAHTVAREQLKEYPDDLEAMRLLARSAARLGRSESALAIYSRFERLARTADATDGGVLSQSARTDQREREAVSSDSKRDPRAQTEPGAGPFQGATSFLKAEDYYLLGSMLSQQGYPRSARQLWEQGRALDPNDPAILEELTRLYAQADDLTPAADAAKHLTTLLGSETRGDLMLGMIRFEQGDPAGAAECLLRALTRDPEARGAPSPPARYRKALARAFLRLGQPVQAREQLQQVLANGSDAEAAWLLSRVALQEGNRTEAAAALEQSGSYRDEFPLVPEPAPYVGALRCRECHSAIYNSQQSSLHARTYFRAGDLKSLPLPDRPVSDRGDPKVVHSIKRVEGALRFETQVGDQTYRALVDHAFGSGDRGLTLVGHDDQGRSRELRLSHYAEGAVWDVTSGHFPQPKHPEEFLGEFLSTDNVRRCFICHTTDDRAAREGIEPVASDHAIGCERCHGPGGNHLKAVEVKLSDLAIANPSHASGEQVVTLCAQCHSPRGRPVSQADPTSVRSQGTTLTWSRCYTQSNGALSCVTCHNPHRNAETSVKHYESKCLECHAKAAAPKAESLKKNRKLPSCPVNPTNGCISCHMPVVTGVIPHSPFTDHDIRVHSKQGAETRTTPSR